MSYTHNKRWRNKNRDKFNQHKKDNYRKGAENAHNRRAEWTPEDLEKITAPNRPSDRQLAKDLGRSVQSIQIKRSRLKNAQID